MQTFQKIIERQNINTVKVVSALAVRKKNKNFSHRHTQRGRAATKFLWASMSFFAHADISL